MTKKIVIPCLLLCIGLVGCSGIENEIVGTWETQDNACGKYIDKDEKIEFDDDNMIVGIEGFKEYKIDDDQDPAILTLSGGYEDVQNYEIKIDDDALHIVQEDKADEGFNSAFACKYEKVS